MRLNLGCGSDIRPGYVNVDFRQLPGVDRIVDLSVFPWPFEDESADEILMLDFLEHFPYSQTRRILLECHRVLRDRRPPEGLDVPSGTGLVIQAPDAVILGSVLSGRGKFQCNRCGWWMAGYREAEFTKHCGRCGQSDDDVWEAAMRRMYGGQDHPGNFHQTCFTDDSLARLARSCGLHWQRSEEREHQAANWNFKAVFIKGDIW